jgi:hypothetical protein
VRVYRNLHRRCYSVLQGGVVVAHAERLMLADCTTVVLPAGARRAQREGRKNVHAFIQGTVVDSAMGTTAEDDRPLPVRFRYALGRGFVSHGFTPEHEVHGAMAVKLLPTGASYAYGANKPSRYR